MVSLSSTKSAGNYKSSCGVEDCVQGRSALAEAWTEFIPKYGDPPFQVAGWLLQTCADWLLPRQGQGRLPTRLTGEQLLLLREPRPMGGCTV